MLYNLVKNEYLESSHNAKVAMTFEDVRISKPRVRFQELVFIIHVEK